MIYKQLCVELVDSIEVLLEMRPVEARPLQITEGRLARARAELAKPEPKRLTVEEISDLPQHRDNFIAEDENGGIQLDGRFSRADLQQLADSIPTFMRTTAKLNWRAAAKFD